MVSLVGKAFKYILVVDDFVSLIRQFYIFSQMYYDTVNGLVSSWNEHETKDRTWCGFLIHVQANLHRWVYTGRQSYLFIIHDISRDMFDFNEFWNIW